MTLRHLLQHLFILAFINTIDGQDYEIYVSDAGNFNAPPWQILKYDMNGNGSVFIDDHLAWPQDIVFLEDKGEVLIANLNNGRISRFHLNTGDFISEFATGIGGPTRMQFGADGYLYVLQWVGNGKVWRYDRDGNKVDEFTSAGVNSSIGLAWDTSGNLYVSSYYDRLVRKFGVQGEDLGNFIATNLAGPTNIWFDAAGDMLVNDYNAGQVKRFGPDGTYKGVYIGAVPQCEGIAFLPDGDLLLGVGGTSSVRRYQSDGTPAGDFVPPGDLHVLTPNAVVLRALSPSYTRETEEYTSVQCVTPTIGTLFHFDTTLEIKEGSEVIIRNAAGQIVDRFIYNALRQWNADHVPDGLCYIQIRLGNGQVGRQTVIIQH